MNSKAARELYANRRLSLGYPELEKAGVAYYKEHQHSESQLAEILRCIDRLTDLPARVKTVAVIGCGPNPYSVKELLSMGYDAVGIEPVSAYIQLGGEFLGDPTRVKLGSVEELPLADQSQSVVFLESVLEHVDSPEQALAEIYRVLLPGGVAFIRTVNRLRISLTGWNPEFSVPFYNWFPAIVKECFVHEHLHYAPHLANYTPRPAVHWFSYADLCKYGRQAGFHQFYSKLDLLEAGDPSLGKSWLRRFAFTRMRYNPWLRSLALSQLGDNIFMLKRSLPGARN